MNNDYAFVFLMLLFCTWSFSIAYDNHYTFFPFGKWGKGLLLVNSVILWLVSLTVLIWHLYDLVNGI